MTDGRAIADTVRSLEGMGLEALRDEWRRRYGPPPSLRSADLLRRNLAWRIQADAFGGLDEWTQRALFGKAAPQPSVPMGTRVAREWRGVRHEVEVNADGVTYRGETYASLSEVARTITGVRWNGPRFFGLRRAA